MRQCDVAVIGAGPGGYVAAIRAAQRGGKAIVIERAELGGVCLNWGCIPTKTLIHTARLDQKLLHAKEYGLVVEGIHLDLDALQVRKQKIIDQNKGGVRNLFRSRGIEVVFGEAVVTAPGRITVGDDEIDANSIIVATGSSPAQLPGLETDGQRVITSTEALNLTEIPKRIAVIGAGALLA